MIGVVHILNPFEPMKPGSHRGLSVDPRKSVRDILNTLGVKEGATPFIVFVDNEPALMETWDKPLADLQTVRVCPVVQGGIVALIIIAIVAVAAIAVALSLSVPIPSSPQIAEPDPVYSLKGQTNQLKLGDPIESHYGRTRIWPSYGAKPYNLYLGNEAYQFQLFCLGQGEYEIEQVTAVDQIFIEDTPIQDFADVEYEVIGPNGDVTLFRDNVQTSSEVGSIELFGPNEPEFDDWFEAVANDAGTTTDKIELDIVLPRGLYTQNNSGGLLATTVSASFEYIEINDVGTEIGTWATLATFSKTLATVSTKRFTLSQAVPFGRYKIRGKRTNDASTSHRVGDTLVWEALRAYLPNVGNYGDVTMLAVKARASSNLNDQSERKFNLVVTRKLPIYNTGTETWSANTATRNPVWAFCDVFRAVYGANLADKYLDLVSLTTLAATLESESKWFDWTFDNKTTVWEAAKLVARSVRGVPLLAGSQVYFMTDRPKTVTQHLFNAENIVEGSFSQGVSLWRVEENDSIEIEYRDPTSWKPETVLCALPSSQGVKPEKIILAGVTDRDRAYQEGMFLISAKKLQREEVQFKSGVEGLIATYGDLIKVDIDTLGVTDSVGGLVESIEADGVTVNLSRAVAFTGGFDYRLLLRGRDGTPYGPYTVTAGATSLQVVSSTAIDANVIFPSFGEQPLFIFGRSVSFAKDCVITGLRPVGNDTVEVTAIAYKSAIYEYDDATAPALNNPSSLPVNVALPTVTGVGITRIEGDLFKINWNAAQGAQYYIIQISSDPTQFDGNANEAWDTVGQTTGLEFDVTIPLETVFVRVAGVNTGQGPWATNEFLLDGATRTTIEDDGLIRDRIVRGTDNFRTAYI